MMDADRDHEFATPVILREPMHFGLRLLTRPLATMQVFADFTAQNSTVQQALTTETWPDDSVAMVEDTAETLHLARLEQMRQWQAEEQALRAAYDRDCQQLHRLIDELRQQRQQVLQGMEPVLAALVVQVTVQMLGQQARQDALAGALARQAIADYQLAGELQIQVSADDYESLRRNPAAADLLPLLQVNAQAEVGSCVIDYGEGLVDAGLEAQLEQLRQVLRSGASVESAGEAAHVQVQ